MTELRKATNQERNIMMIMTAAVMFFNIIGAIIVYITCKVYKKESEYIKTNGLNLINYYISFVIYQLIILVLCVFEIGKFLLPIMTVVYIGIYIMALMNYYNYESFKYPLSFNFFKKI